MQTLIKLSNNYTDVLAQLPEIQNLNYKQELKSNSSLTFTIQTTDPQLDFITDLRKVELIGVIDGVDVSLWTGYVSKPEIGIDFSKIICSDEKRYMEKKIIFANKNWASKPIDEILDELVSEANARSGTSELSYETDIGSTLYTQKPTIGTSYKKILDAIANEFEAEWTVVKNKIILKQTIGTDRTSGSNFFELVSDVNNPKETNISNVARKYNSEKIVTSVMGKSKSAYSSQTGNTAEFGHIEGFKSFSEGNVSDQTAAYLDENKESQEEITFNIDPARVELLDLFIGDLVPARVSQGIPRLDFEANLKVISKTVTIQNNFAQTTIRMSDKARNLITAENVIAQMANDIEQLQIDT